MLHHQTPLYCSRFVLKSIPVISATSAARVTVALWLGGGHKVTFLNLSTLDVDRTSIERIEVKVGKPVTSKILLNPPILTQTIQYVLPEM